MAGTDATAKLFEAINQSSDAIVDAVRAANDRGHRFSAAMIEQAQENQREAVELAKKWAASPLDFFGIYSSIVETATKGQSRALEATREIFGELAEAQKETRQLLQRLATANRTAGEATVEVARNMFTRATEAVQQATDGNGRRSAGPSRTAEAITETP
jgi:hypothetical protein